MKKKKKRSYLRFEYLDECISRLTFKETEKVKVASFLLYLDEEISLNHDDSTHIKINRGEERYFQEWVFSEMGMMRLAPYSKKMEQKFKDGDDNALFEFCSNSEYAFRFWWVVEQLEKWRLKNNTASISKVKKVFKSYANLKGKTQSDRMADIINKDIDYVKYINKELDKGKRVKDVFYNASQKYDSINSKSQNYSSLKSISQIYYKFKSYNFFVRINSLKSNWRGCVAGFPKNLPSIYDIDPLLEKTFNLRTFLNNLHKELEFFKKLRRKIWKVKYKKNDIPLLWHHKPNKLKSQDMDLFYKEAKYYWKSDEEIKNAFNDYIKWERLVNNENQPRIY